jgi:NodT family efflux transporter outer membrane factor (OMF) lipoprotein
MIVKFRTWSVERMRHARAGWLVFAQQHRMKKSPRIVAGIAAGLLISGCAVGPNYQPPTMTIPPAFKEAGNWKPAAPADTTERGAWWTVFHDPVLDELERQVATSNQTLKQAEAAYEQARQLARSDRGTLFPSLAASGSAQRSKQGAGRIGTSTTPVVSGTRTAYSASLQTNWEIDLWGRVRRTVESGVATAEATAADLAAVRLSLESTLAQNYIDLRVLDQRRRLLDDAIAAYRRTLQISQNRLAAGVVSRSDVISAQTQLDNARAEAIGLGVQRAQLEHAIAVLVGKLPAEFSIEPQPSLALTLPEIPQQAPSTLLERRPDIARAEREVAAANARIGVQVAGYFPALTLSASGGYDSSSLTHLFDLPNRFWSLGADVADTIFDWGQRHDNVLATRAAYDASVAAYRQTVLQAFQDAEDALASVAILAEQAVVQDAAMTESAEAARIAQNEYNAGTVDFTTVAAAQVTELNTRISSLTILRDRLTSSVLLIAALGGGWTTSELPTSQQVLASQP